MLRACCLGVMWLLLQTACSGSDGTESVPQKQRGGASTKSEHTGGVSSASGGIGGNPDADGMAGVAGVTGQAPKFGPLGRGCDASLPCEGGLRCFAAGGTELGDVSPAGGMCTEICATDAECAVIEAGAHCVELLADGAEPLKICAPGCTLGDAHACGGRPELACWPLDGGAGITSERVCLPTCNHDDQCPSGTVCDGYYNLCSS